MDFARQCRHGTALVAAVMMVYACGGGGAAPISEPNPPDAGVPPAGTPPAAPPATPSGPPTPPAAPSSATISTPERTFSPAAVTIAASGTVTWQAVDDDHEIVFLSAAPPGGNIGDLDEGASASRTFPTAGTYEYECLRHRDKGMRGTIVVEAPPAVPPPSAPPPANPPSGSTATVTTPGTTFSPAEVTISTGGSVTWQFSGARHNVTFQGTAPPGGNILDQDPGASVSRTFATAGTYSYVCTRHSGMTGRVTVQ
jgi:plastocyanin